MAQARLTVGLNGFGRRTLTSVETMRRYYIKALSLAFNTVNLTTCENEWSNRYLDAVVTYFDPDYWKQSVHPPYPLIFPLHGDAVSRQEFLRQHLGYLETSDTLIVNSQSDIRILRKMLAGPMPNLAHLHFPVDTAIYRKQGSQECRARLSLKGADLVIGFVARLIPQKNLHQFIRMFAELKRRVSPRRLHGVIAGTFCKAYPVLDFGTEGYEAYIKTLQVSLGVDNDLLYLGDIPAEQLSLCYGAMDVLLHPTNNLEEAFGSVPVEAMACGVPVVGAAYGGLKDTIVPGYTGFLMPTWITKSGIRTDFSYGVEAATLLLNDPELRERMSVNCVERARCHYSYDNFSESLCSAVIRSIKLKKAGNAQPLIPIRAVKRRVSAGFLPELAEPWEAYWESVAEYVSDGIPVLAPDSFLTLASPVSENRMGIFQLDDPAWPGVFRLSEADCVVLGRCNHKVAIDELRALNVDDSKLQELLELGLLRITSPATLEKHIALSRE